MASAVYKFHNDFSVSVKVAFLDSHHKSIFTETGL